MDWLSWTVIFIILFTAGGILFLVNYQGNIGALALGFCEKNGFEKAHYDSGWRCEKIVSEDTIVRKPMAFKDNNFYWLVNQ